MTPTTVPAPGHRVAAPEPGQVWVARFGPRKGTTVTVVTADATFYNGFVRVQTPHRVSTLRRRTLEDRYTLLNTPGEPRNPSGTMTCPDR